MPSNALLALTTALGEVTDLTRAKWAAGIPRSTELRLARVAGRASVALLSSHFERYFYAVNEEAVAYVNLSGVAPASLPSSLRLLHSKEPIDQLAAMVWENRDERLGSFVTTDAWLWAATGLPGSLLHSRLLGWMKAPKPEHLRRYYRYWNIPDKFAVVCRTQQTRQRLWLGVQELVDKRNNIAHGDIGAQATRADVERYTKSVQMFCARADRHLAKTLAQLCSRPAPW